MFLLIPLATPCNEVFYHLYLRDREIEMREGVSHFSHTSQSTDRVEPRSPDSNVSSPNHQQDWGPLLCLPFANIMALEASLLYDYKMLIGCVILQSCTCWSHSPTTFLCIEEPVPYLVEPLPTIFLPSQRSASLTLMQECTYPAYQGSICRG